MNDEFYAWVADNLPDLAGKTALVTGANSGIGYFTALGLAMKGASVIVAGRDEKRVGKAIEDIRAEVPSADVHAGIVDLASLASVKAFAQAISKQTPQIDILINNAGVMMPPEGRTEDGFETQFGVNFIGHFALTGYLYPNLKAQAGSRVVTLSSIAHRGAVIDFENLRGEKAYDPRREYYQSKLADLMFTLELARRVDDAGDEVLSVASHPGFTKTELQRHLDPKILEGMNFMDTWQGALPTLVAATSASAKAGDYYGPDGPGEYGGFPALGEIDASAQDADVARALWDYAEEATGVRYPY